MQGTGPKGRGAGWEVVDKVLLDGGLLSSWSEDRHMGLLLTGYATGFAPSSFDRHADLFAKGRNRAGALPFFERLVRTTMDSGGNITPVMTWANKYFRRPEQKEAMYAVLERTLAPDQAEAYAHTLYEQFKQALYEAARKGAFDTYNSFQDQARELLRPAETFFAGPKVRHLKTGHIKHRPTLEPFAGTLVSSGAVVRLSAPDPRQDRPLLHRELVSDPDLGGFMCTRSGRGADAGSWVRLDFRGPAEVSGIVLVARWEQPEKRLSRENGNLRISLSVDGRTGRRRRGSGGPRR
jgi:hypothetical protein